jgi:Leucine Rich repeat
MDLQEACKRLRQNHDASLTLLNLNGQGIGTAGLKSLLTTHNIPHNESQPLNLSPLLPPASASLPFVVLWLENDELYSGGAKILERVVLHSPRLKYLYLAHNSIGNSGVQALVPTAFSQLRVLNLADNDIGPEGAQVISNCLARETALEQRSSGNTVTTLILESNKLGDEGAISLAKGLRHSTSLKELDLRFNKIGIQGLNRIRDSLVQANTTLYRLYLEEEDDCKLWKQQQQQDAALTRKQKCLAHQRRCSPMKRCRCSRCKVRIEIVFYLALNRAGRHSFGNTKLNSGLWPRIVGRISQNEDPSVLFSLLTNRPDIVQQQN